MDLNFYSDLSDGTGQPGDPEFLDPQAFNGFDAVQKVKNITLMENREMTGNFKSDFYWGKSFIF